MKFLRTLMCAGALCAPALALPPVHAALPQPPTQKAAAPAGTVKPALPEPTQLERVQLENIQLRMMLLQDEERSLPQRRQDLQQQYGDLVRKIESEHPGYVWNPQTASLVKAPKPKAKGEK